jgi:hypothetical protein
MIRRMIVPLTDINQIEVSRKKIVSQFWASGIEETEGL